MCYLQLLFNAASLKHLMKPPHLLLPTTQAEQHLDMLMTIESNLRLSIRKCVYRGGYLECCPGGKM
ncbi:hypothetical protein J6590_066666 [Homalodisca vitripennis]|nr:hypothetical protein J6590_066666 [Homalodisca vitripennis]